MRKDGIMPPPAKSRSDSKIIPMLAKESLYVGIDVGKHRHIAGFVSNTLLARHERFEGCPVLAFEQSRQGFRDLIDRIQSYVPLEQCFVLLEQTGHYHKALVEYLLDLDISVYVMHVQERPKGMMKTDKRDALGLANHLYNLLEKGIQVSDKARLARRAFPPTEAAALLKGLVRHRYELSHECTQRRNKLIAIYDELFPEFTQVFKDPNGPSALAFREKFSTPQAVATASITALHEARIARYPSDENLVMLQQLAGQSIGTHNLGRQRGLLLEQTQLITELKLLQNHIEQLDQEILHIVRNSREGKILTSLPPIGPIQAAMMIAAIGTIANFQDAAALKSYFGWAPSVVQSGASLNRDSLTRGGTRPLKKMMFLIVGNAIRMDCEWAKIYERLVPIKCAYDERTRSYKGKLKVVGRIAGQMISLIYALLKKDWEALAATPPGTDPPEPTLYDPAVHRAHREGAYRSQKPHGQQGRIIQLPPLPR
jgi:transposase